MDIYSWWMYIPFCAESAPPTTQTTDTPPPSWQPLANHGEAGKYCCLCGAWFNNPLMAQQHYEGKKHKRNAARARLLEQLAGSLDANESTGQCSIAWVINVMSHTTVMTKINLYVHAVVIEWLKHIQTFPFSVENSVVPLKQAHKEKELQGIQSISISNHSCCFDTVHPEFFSQIFPYLCSPLLNPVSDFVLFKCIFHIDVITRHVSHTVCDPGILTDPISRFK